MLVIIRPAPLRRGPRAGSASPRSAAQLAFIVLGLVAGSSGSGRRCLVADILLVGGLLFAIASVAFLGRCFGVLPDVRGLVMRGPYRLVRHPLYLGELTAAAGHRDRRRAAGRWPLAAWLVCARRCSWCAPAYEERSLRAEFPEYGQYAERTERLIPGVV